MDTMPKDARSALMARIRSKNSTPELLLRSGLHHLGLRFRIHRQDLPGTPDLVFISARIAIFVHGCFWHQHPKCKLASSPKSNVDYWKTKLERNVRRDAEVIDLLRDLGWEVIIVWECEMRDKVQFKNVVESIQARVHERKKPKCC
ncbi:very short patch repair endonuclease [Burkholderia metallica]|uniref:very short patch repair endonuclease n=1 Tax=Burkholderia metallica TaxID=488729 RepID=UPI001CF114DC|nr:very short patch repair endonuclease [Burkholderia metallica]MCA8003167.1 very short patch repair endonuclease [Burkholderia metallica]